MRNKPGFLGLFDEKELYLARIVVSSIKEILAVDLSHQKAIMHRVMAAEVTDQDVQTRARHNYDQLASYLKTITSFET